MTQFAGQVALVTGASKGIGAAVAKALHAAGATVGLSGTRVEPLQALAAELGARAYVLPCDLGNAAAVEESVKQATEAIKFELVHRLEELVADPVPVHVVDLLEVVEVNEHQRQSLPRLDGVLDRVWQMLFEPVAVWQQGQRIVTDCRFNTGSCWRQRCVDTDR